MVREQEQWNRFNFWILFAVHVFDSWFGVREKFVTFKISRIFFLRNRILQNGGAGKQTFASFYFFRVQEKTRSLRNERERESCFRVKSCQVQSRESFRGYRSILAGLGIVVAASNQKLKAGIQVGCFTRAGLAFAREFFRSFQGT